MLHTLIIESRPVIREGIKCLLNEKFDNIRLIEVDNIQNIKNKSQGFSPELVIMAIDRQGGNRIAEVKSHFRESKIIIFDPSGSSESAIQYLKFGAHGYLSQESDASMLERCVGMVLEGKYYIDPSDFNSMLTELIDHGSVSTKPNSSMRKLSLTMRQREIAFLLAQGMGTSKIAERLGLKASTISTVKYTIFSKLNVQSIIELNRALSTIK